jgi:hypothetical protein
MIESSSTDRGILRVLERAGQRARRIFRGAAFIALAAAGALMITARDSGAHEIPSSVGLRIFVQQDSAGIRVLVRAPLEAMRDIMFPLRPATPYLDLARADSLLRQAALTWIVDLLHVRAGDDEIAGTLTQTRLSLTSDRSFATAGQARRHFTDPRLDPRYDIPVQSASLDVEILYPARPTAGLTIEPELARLGVRTTTVMTFVSASGDERAFEYTGDPGRVRLDPRWYHAAGQFVRLGFVHILDGIDHLLFIICLVLPFRKLRPLIGIVTAFTVAHSLTLIASAAGWAPDALWFPPLVEVLIALSIAWMAIENIVMAARERPAALDRRWIMAFGFGLVHGFGFSFALRESLQFAGSHLALSLVSFNIGVEIGQVAVLLVALPLLALLYRRVASERVAVIIISAFVTHTAWHWLGDRWSVLRQYQVDWRASAMPLTRIALGMVVVAGTVFVITRLIRLRASRIQGDAA